MELRRTAGGRFIQGVHSVGFAFVGDKKFSGATPYAFDVKFEKCICGG